MADSAGFYVMGATCVKDSLLCFEGFGGMGCVRMVFC